eukprot:gnl/TRDRNA2_/TRDRNA2_149701_c0_seq1.p1 gnl/TRDRNA2_/TRDRNA2_149701_c0~~gnl/TRDRNA2_/TRDRNA2_149701_c0_seq1.p1  ORF type:complete len:393 (-),score=63.54 gnl/TRDRNA2_/TRDRNA2_149701_c0_seq1:89-1267(-)
MQKGMASVIQEVFSFLGSEFYIHSVEETAGRTFRELICGLPDCVAVGIQDEGGEALLLPSMDRPIMSDTKLILFAEDVATLPASSSVATSMRWAESLSMAKARKSVLTKYHSHMAEDDVVAEVVVIMGWNESIGSVLVELDKNVGPGSQVVLYSPCPTQEQTQFVESAQRRRNHKFQNFSVEHRTGLLGARFQLEALPLVQSKKIIILADSRSRSPSAADSQTMALVLQVQDIIDGQVAPDEHPVIIPQILENATEHSCMKMGLFDHINSNQLAARIMALVCVNPDVLSILNDVIKGHVRFVIRHLSEYPGGQQLCECAEVTFSDVAATAAMRGEIAIGWSEELSDDDDRMEHLIWDMNPQRDKPRRWRRAYRVVSLTRRLVKRLSVHQLEA